MLLKREYLLARNILKRHHEFDEVEGVTKEIIASERLKQETEGLENWVDDPGHKGNHRV